MGSLEETRGCLAEAYANSPLDYKDILEGMQVVYTKLKRDLKRMKQAIEVVEYLWEVEQHKAKEGTDGLT